MITLMVIRTREIVRTGTAGGGSSLHTSPGTSMMDQFPDPTLAVVEVTHTAGQVLNQ